MKGRLVNPSSDSTESADEATGAVDAEPVIFDAERPTAWVAECPYCLHTLHIVPKGE
jgi:hypothetical protein